MMSGHEPSGLQAMYRLPSPIGLQLLGPPRIGEHIGHVIQFTAGARLIWVGGGWGLFKRGVPDKVAEAAPEAVCPNCGRSFHPQNYNPEAREKLCSACGHSLPENCFDMPDNSTSDAQKTG